MFDVLVMNYDTLLSDFNEINKIQFGAVVFDCEDHYNSFPENIWRRFSSVGKIVRYSADNNLISKIIMNQNQKSSLEAVPLTEHQRLLFLRYALVFGINIDTPEELLENLIIFQKNVIAFENTNQSLVNLKFYLHEFLTVLQNDQSKFN
jgi:hypothetical protein